MSDKKKVHIFGKPEERLTAFIAGVCREHSDDLDIVLHEGQDEFENVINSPSTKIIFMSTSLPGFSAVRKERKDIFLVGLIWHKILWEKEDPTKGEVIQYMDCIKLLKNNSANLIFSMNEHSGITMVVTPEEAKYHVATNIGNALRGLVEMAYLRSHLTFTRSTVVAGDRIPWDSQEIPNALRTVVNYCVAKNAYKPIEGNTVGHFACKKNDTTFLTSIRRSNFNNLSQIGLVKIVTDGPDNVIAYGSKPSVGGQSQRLVFLNHTEYDCIVHFHCPLKEGREVSIVSQREYECGSHECGQNTSNGLRKYGNLSAVYLEQHGPNIVFHSSIDPQEVIDFIEFNFDLSQKTGGYIDLGAILPRQSCCHL